jgi:hypothetical protein
MKVLPIKPEESYPWILQKHYAKRVPQISYAFGLYEENQLMGVVTYGMPASPFLCIGVCGPEYRDVVIELNRLCLQDNKKNEASFLVANSLKQLPKPKVVVSYADTAMGHVGYVYQACNFLFTGTTKERTDMASTSGGHSRHNSGDRTQRVDRSAKHRYIFIVGSKQQKKKFTELLRYDVLPYPKGDNKNYDAGGQVMTQPVLFL